MYQLMTILMMKQAKKTSCLESKDLSRGKVIRAFPLKSGYCQVPLSFLSLLTFCAMITTTACGGETMTDLMTEVVNGERYQYYPLGEHVVRAVGVCGGRPTFKYTRIEIIGTLDRLATGESLDTIIAGYRGRVSREAVMEAIQIVMDGFLKTLPTLESV
jgi:uncharacterized protein (DUF433 family)